MTRNNDVGEKRRAFIDFVFRKRGRIAAEGSAIDDASRHATGGRDMEQVDASSSPATGGPEGSGDPKRNDLGEGRGCTGSRVEPVSGSRHRLPSKKGSPPKKKVWDAMAMTVQEYLSDRFEVAAERNGSCIELVVKGFPVYRGENRGVRILLPYDAVEIASDSTVRCDIGWRPIRMELDDGRGFPHPCVFDNGFISVSYGCNTLIDCFSLLMDTILWRRIPAPRESRSHFVASRLADEIRQHGDPRAEMGDHQRRVADALGFDADGREPGEFFKEHFPVNLSKAFF